MLAPGVGYFVRNNGPGERTLEIPPIGAVAARVPNTVPGVLADVDPGWSVQVTAAAGAFSDPSNRFGQRPGATDVTDELDWSDPPAPPAGFANVSLLARDGRPLFADYHAPSSRGSSWELLFESDQVGEPYRVSFVPDRPLPDGWSIVAFESKGAKEFDLTERGVLTGVVGHESFAREWTIVAGTSEHLEHVREDFRASVTSFAFSAPFPNPLGEGRTTGFDLEIPVSSPVRVQVFDVRGRLVRTLVDRVLDRGAHRVEWDGRDRAGNVTAAGVYFANVRAGEFERSQKVVRR
jgi:hypothetical protein